MRDGDLGKQITKLLAYLECLCAAREQAQKQMGRYRYGEHYGTWVDVHNGVVQQIRETEKELSKLLGHKVERIDNDKAR